MKNLRTEGQELVRNGVAKVAHFRGTIHTQREQVEVIIAFSSSPRIKGGLSEPLWLQPLGRGH
jgi:hypothetical protein